MKLKIFAAPAIIAAIVVVSIWVVYPAYQTLQTKKAELGKSQSKLVDIQEKNNRAAELALTLTTKTDQISALLHYIPEQQKEEEIIANLNALAGASGLSVYDISIGGIEKKEKTVATQNSGNFLIPNISDAPAGSGTVAQVKPETNTFKVSLGVAGGYGKIRDMLSKIAALQRFNSIASMKIAKAQQAGAQDDSGTSDNLQADISLNFNFINKSNSIVNLDNEIFSSGSFDMAVVDGIRNQMTTVVNGLTVEANGVQNPFIK